MTSDKSQAHALDNKAVQQTSISRGYSIPPLLLQTLIWPVTRCLFSVFGHWKIVGLKEHVLPLKKPIIFASNHSSETDVFMVPAALPFLSRHMPIFYLSRPEKEFYKTLGWRSFFYGGVFFKAWGAFPILSKQRNYEVALQRHISILNDNQNIFIFPEGGRHPEIKMENIHGGVAYLAYRTGATVIPVGTFGNGFMPAREFFSFKRRITTYFGEPMRVEDIFGSSTPESPDDFKAGAIKIMDRVRKLGN